MAFEGGRKERRDHGPKKSNHKKTAQRGYQRGQKHKQKTSTKQIEKNSFSRKRSWGREDQTKPDTKGEKTHSLLERSKIPRERLRKKTLKGSVLTQVGGDKGSIKKEANISRVANEEAPGGVALAPVRWLRGRWIPPYRQSKGEVSRKKKNEGNRSGRNMVIPIRKQKKTEY